MKIVVLDGFTENPGDISWAPLEALGEVTVYDRTAYEESDLIAERIGDAEIAVINKTPISKATIDKCPNLKAIAVLATGYNVVDYTYAKEKGIPEHSKRIVMNKAHNRFLICVFFSFIFADLLICLMSYVYKLPFSFIRMDICIVIRFI